MCAICFAYIYKVNINQIRNVLINLTPEKYRNEKIATINKIHFINDSKSTNIYSTLASVDAVSGAVLLLLGGSNKGLDYTQLFNKLSKKVVQIAVFGEIANDFLKDNANKFKIEKFTTLKQAFDFLISIAKHNDTILLSPASASYDQYENYIERGKDFNNMVREYESLSTKK